VATCLGSLIVHAHDTIAGCTEDDEQYVCLGRDERHDHGNVRCVNWYCEGFDYRGIQPT